MANLLACSVCSEQFSTTYAYQDHIRDSNHVQISFICAHCFHSFDTDRALRYHLRSLAKDQAHPSQTTSGPQQAVAQHRCPTCARKFRSAHALSQHSKSALAHAPRKLKCTFCKKKYKSPSAVAHHIESGCHKFTRHQVTAAVRAMDIVPEITAKTIEVSEAPPPTIITYIATEDMFNGNSYSRSKCPRTFRTLRSLDRHLNSAAHDDNEFRCPKCKAEFTLISGFVQHLESRSCGLSKIKQVENFFNDLADRFSGLLKM